MSVERLVEHFAALEDPRCAGKVEHQLTDILVIAVCAVIACADRHDRGSIILTTQVPVDRWHAVIGDPTYADAILDRIVHAAYRIELKGESLRKARPDGGPPATSGIDQPASHRKETTLN